MNRVESAQPTIHAPARVRLFSYQVDRWLTVGISLLLVALIADGIATMLTVAMGPSPAPYDALVHWLGPLLGMAGIWQLVPLGLWGIWGRRDLALVGAIGGWIAAATIALVTGPALIVLPLAAFALGAAILFAVLLERSWAPFAFGVGSAMAWSGGLGLRAVLIEHGPSDDVVMIGTMITFPALLLLVFARFVSAMLAIALATVDDLEQVREALEVANGVLVTARDEARAASDAKSRFLASMSHELRTPLNAIIGYSELLFEEETLTNEGRTDLGRVRAAGRHLLSLVDDVLDMSALEAGQLRVEPGPTLLAPLLGDLELTIEPLIRDHGNRLRVDVGPDLGMVWVDPERLRQVLLNLLSNAGKFTTNGLVVLSAAATQDGCVVEVKDTGRGIPGDKLEAIFEPFVRIADDPGVTEPPGTGLGLSIVRDLLARMQGTIAVESQLGVGSRFIVHLPAAASAARAAVG